MRRRAPRGIAAAVRAVRAEAAPPTLLGAVQSLWPQAVGETIAGEATPVGEREGIIRVSCRSAVWAQELDLMRPELVERLNARLETPIADLRFAADAARHDPAAGT